LLGAEKQTAALQMQAQVGLKLLKLQVARQIWGACNSNDNAQHLTTKSLHGASAWGGVGATEETAP
jgi:hypothetical protein